MNKSDIVRKLVKKINKKRKRDGLKKIKIVNLKLKKPPADLIEGYLRKDEVWATPRSFTDVLPFMTNFRK